MKWITKNWQICLTVFFLCTTTFFGWTAICLKRLNIDQERELELTYNQLLKEQLRIPAIEDCEYICETEFCPECKTETIYLEDLEDN